MLVSLYAPVLAVLLSQASQPASAPTVLQAVSAPAPVQDKEVRGLALEFGIGAMSPTIEYDFGQGNIWLAGGLLTPMLSDGRTGGLTLAGGPSMALGKSKRFKLEFYAHATLMFEAEPSYTYNYSYNYAPIQPAVVTATFAFGVGLGGTYTMPNGFMVGFRLPVFGYSVGGTNRTGSTALAYYYFASVVSAPGFILGYKFQ